jgi:hypothetical protein
LDAVDELGRFRNQADTSLSVIGPEGREAQSGPIPMRQSGPGRYEARWKTPHQGIYHLRIEQRVGPQLVLRQTRGWVVGYPEELRLRATNVKFLKRLAEVSGGQYNPTPKEALQVGSRVAYQAQPIWTYLLAMAAGLLCVDVALRRIDFSLLIGQLADRASSA